MKLNEFHYDLPDKLIAQHPLENRAEAKLLILDRKTGAIMHRRFYEIVEYLSNGDVLVLNDTKVFKARLFGKKETGARIEVFIISYNQNECVAFVRPGRRIKERTPIVFTDGISAEIKHRAQGRYYLEFSKPVDEVIKHLGKVPLPHYIKRPAEKKDEEEYQTIYARKTGSVAAPTAGLHFTKKILEALEKQGVRIVYITLHIGPGTFKPIRSEDITKHYMDPEFIEVDEKSAEAINSGTRIIGVGTSVARTLEFIALKNADNDKKIITFSGYADLFIYPGFKFRVLDSLITNFHLPCSTPLLLVCAFAGKELIFKAYKEVVEQRYRFLSYGDAMLII
jgi:S-adenosylmethionine:tRNA ribosyltransferase-isomerase